MTLPPADWYDDPENPSSYRYWNGREWTEHRSPKSIPTPPGSSGGSVFEIFGQTFATLSATWREAVIVALPLVLGTIGGAALIYTGVDLALNIDPNEFFDRVTTPGFNPSSGADEAFLDSIELDITGSSVLCVVFGLLFWWFAGMLSTIGLSRLFIAHHKGRSLPARDALSGAIRRIPRMALWWCMLIGFAVAAALVLVFVGVFAPILLLLLLPAVIAAGVWLIPYYTIAGLVVAVAPTSRGIVQPTRDVVPGRWGFIFVRLLLLIVLNIALGFPIGIVSNAVLMASVLGYLLFTALVQAFQTVVGQAGYLVIYDALGAEIDPELCTGASDSGPVADD